MEKPKRESTKMIEKRKRTTTGPVLETIVFQQQEANFYENRAGARGRATWYAQGVPTIIFIKKQPPQQQQQQQQ